MALARDDEGNSTILQPLKEAVISIMEGFKDLDDIEFVWKDRVNSWHVNNKKSLTWKAYPAVYTVIPRVRKTYFAIQRKKGWIVELQIEIYFADFTDVHEAVAMEWVEEVDRMCRTNPKLGQPDPDKFKVMDWVATVSDFDYFVKDNHLLMGVINATEISLIDCR